MLFITKSLNIIKHKYSKFINLYFLIKFWIQFKSIALEN